MLVEEYRTRLRKLVTSVGDYRVRRALPAAWSAAGMQHFKMSVESEASSLMLSPGGRTIPKKSYKIFFVFLTPPYFQPQKSPSLLSLVFYCLFLCKNLDYFIPYMMWNNVSFRIFFISFVLIPCQKTPLIPDKIPVQAKQHKL